MKYSIITINYNNKKGLRDTIESVIHQTFRDFEYIIIDGGSTDGSVDVLREYDKHITYWVSEPDRGIYHAMNKGIIQAHGAYFIFMNSGDCFYNDTVLNDVLMFLDKDIVVGKSYYENGIHGFYKQDITLLDLFKGTLPHQATFFKRSLFENHFYDEKYRIISDLKFYIESLIIQNASFSNLDTIICKFEGNGISANPQSYIGEPADTAFSDCIPKRIINDYQYFLQIPQPCLDLFSELNKTPKIKNIFIYICRIILKIHKYMLK